MKKKALVILIILSFIFLGLFYMFNNQTILESLGIGTINRFNLEENNEDIEIGAKSIVTSSVITKRTTGVGPFDPESTTDSENSDGSIKWTAGNDVSEDDNIVRSFDQITWTIENTMTLKENATVENFKGGKIEVKATLPSNCANFVKWDLESMAWAENAEVSADGITFTAQYSMSENEITVPGKQTLVLVLKVLNASNGLEIIPTFSINLYGNDENEVYQVIDSRVIVSAAPKYNIELVRNTSLSNKTTIEYEEEDLTGRMYGYGLVLQLYNVDANKGLKGIEYPKGDINFNIDLKLTRSKLGSTELEDITDECTPILWNYKVNQNTTTGIIANRDMRIVNSESQYYKLIPYGIKTNDRTKSTYNSGTIEMIQNNKTINATISNYSFDNIFPTYPAYTTSTTPPNIWRKYWMF